MLTFEQAWQAVAWCQGRELHVRVSGPSGPLAVLDGELRDGDADPGGVFLVVGEGAFALRRAAFVEAEWREADSALVVRERGDVLIEVEPVPEPDGASRRVLEVVP